MPCDYSTYPKNWDELRRKVLERADNRCEGSPKYPNCREENYKPHQVTGSKVILTVAHLDHDVKNNDLNNLRAWCQRCHLTYDTNFHARNAKKTRFDKKRKLELERLDRWVNGI